MRVFLERVFWLKKQLIFRSKKNPCIKCLSPNILGFLHVLFWPSKIEKRSTSGFLSLDRKWATLGNLE